MYQFVGIRVVERKGERVDRWTVAERAFTRRRVDDVQSVRGDVCDVKRFDGEGGNEVVED